MNLEHISKEKLTDIDLDIYSLMKKIPNNEFYNSLYIRWDKNENDTFVRLLCNEEDLTNLLGILISPNENTTNEEKIKIVEPSKIAILNLCISILKDATNEEVEEFLNFIKEAKKND